MNEKKKSIIYFVIILLLAIAFVTLYLLDSNISESQGKDAFSNVVESLEPALHNEAEDQTNSDTKKSKSTGNEYEGKSETIVNIDVVQVIDWEKSEIDSIQIFSQRKDFTLINHGQPGEKKWSIRSPRVDQKITSTNRALFKLLNVFKHFKTDNYKTQDYSQFAKYFEYPVCEVVANFKDGRQEKLTFIRIAEYNEEKDETEMRTWVRVNEETVVYISTYNILERFLVAEKEFLKFN